MICDTTGVQSTSFTPTKTGNYNFTFNYPEQNYTWTTSQGGTAAYTGVTFLGKPTTTLKSTKTQSVTPPPTLPTEYWSRPIYGTNDNWYTIASHWLGRATTSAPSNKAATTSANTRGRPRQLTHCLDMPL